MPSLHSWDFLGKISAEKHSQLQPLANCGIERGRIGRELGWMRAESGTGWKTDNGYKKQLVQIKVNYLGRQCLTRVPMGAS